MKGGEESEYSRSSLNINWELGTARVTSHTCQTPWTSLDIFHLLSRAISKAF